MNFKLWSDNNLEVKDILKPNLGLRSWGELTMDDKNKIWKYLRVDFFNENIKTKNRDNYYSQTKQYYEFLYNKNEEKTVKQERIFLAILWMNDKYKVNSYAQNFLEYETLSSACQDFYDIFINQDEDVVFELLSLYANVIIKKQYDNASALSYRPYKRESESEDKFEERYQKWLWKPFDDFSKKINEIFDDFGIYVNLTRVGFIKKQAKEIQENIYEPVLEILSNKEYQIVNNYLKKAFADYRNQNYDKVIQNIINTMHSYLQIVNGQKVGAGNLKSVLKSAVKQKIIPHSNFTENIFLEIEKLVSKIRSKKTDAHPSKEIDMATEEDAMLAINLTMVMLQSFVSYKK